MLHKINASLQGLSRLSREYCAACSLASVAMPIEWRPTFDVTVYMVLATPQAKSRLFESLHMGST